MEISNDIVLRPRFSIEITVTPDVLLNAFEQAGTTTKDFVVSRVDDHIFIRIPKVKQHFWSPQLHLEIYKIDEKLGVIKGLFGPSPTVWTLFMFLHFIAATLFIAAGIWMYTNKSLNASYSIPLVAMIALIILWCILYVGGRLGRKTGESEMRALRYFMNYTIKKCQKDTTL